MHHCHCHAHTQVVGAHGPSNWCDWACYGPYTILIPVVAIAVVTIIGILVLVAIVVLVLIVIGHAGGWIVTGLC